MSSLLWVRAWGVAEILTRNDGLASRSRHREPEHPLPWEDAPACAGELRVQIAAAPPEPVHSAITTALAEDRPLAVPVGLQPPYTWSVAAGMDQLPHNGTAFVEELTRRPRLLLAGATDLAAIPATLAGPAGYIAALGSRATHAQRLRRLAGIPGLDRLNGPAGLDLGGTSLAESALSILAELVAANNGRNRRRGRLGGRRRRVSGSRVSGSKPPAAAAR